MSVVPVQHTPVTGAELLEEFGQAWIRVYGAAPSRDTILVLCAQTQLETGGTHCWNFNVGNLKALPDYDSMELNTREVINGQSVMMKCHFSAFNSLAEGCEAQVRFLAQHFPGCLTAAEAGDPGTFASTAKAHGYFTGELGAYIGGMTGAFHTFRATLAPASWEQPA